MTDDSEFGEFSSVNEGWSQQNELATSFTPDWLAFSDNQDWVSSVVPNNEQLSWNATFPELPKELSNLLSDEITSLDDSNSLATPAVVNLPTNVSDGCGHEGDEFGDFECSMDNSEDINVSTNNSAIEPSLNASKPSWATGTSGDKVDLNDDDEFGDFEGPSVPKGPDTVQASDTTVPQDETEDEFGGFVATTTEKTSPDDFGSFETAEFVAVAPPLQAAPPSNFAVAPSSLSPLSFSAVAESCFHLNQTNPQSTITDYQPLNILTEQSR